MVAVNTVQSRFPVEVYTESTVVTGASELKINFVPGRIFRTIWSIWFTLVNMNYEKKSRLRRKWFYIFF